MKICRFVLSGQTAHFKQPDMTRRDMTFGHIHKVALLGMFGAVLGLGGYCQSQPGQLPEFYQKLLDLPVAVIPVKKSFVKKWQVFTNTTGFANNGANLVVYEQWLEHPEWEICFVINSPVAQELANLLKTNCCSFFPYLGKTEHRAVISDVKIEDAAMMIPQTPVRITGLFPKEAGSLLGGRMMYEEALPVSLDDHGFYVSKIFLMTNGEVNTQWELVQLSDGRYVCMY